MDQHKGLLLGRWHFAGEACSTTIHVLPGQRVASGALNATLIHAVVTAIQDVGIGYDRGHSDERRPRGGRARRTDSQLHSRVSAVMVIVRGKRAGIAEVWMPMETVWVYTTAAPRAHRGVLGPERAVVFRGSSDGSSGIVRGRTPGFVPTGLLESAEATSLLSEIIVTRCSRGGECMCFV